MQVPFVPILGHPALFTRTTAQPLLPHLVPVFIASKEKCFQRAKWSPSEAARAVAFTGTEGSLGSGVSDPRASLAVPKGLCISQISRICLCIPPTLNWPCAMKIMHLLGTAPTMPIKYPKAGFQVICVRHLHAHCKEGSTANNPGHATTHFLHQTHKQLNQAAQPSLKTSAYLTLKITPACSALY